MLEPHPQVNEVTNANIVAALQEPLEQTISADATAIPQTSTQQEHDLAVATLMSRPPCINHVGDASDTEEPQVHAADEQLGKRRPKKGKPISLQQKKGALSRAKPTTICLEGPGKIGKSATLQELM